ncbi:MAG: Chaperone SurA [Candidatus Ordinivivax streblomastigis]|uniref:Chaperone SurA n=1 Tax=Candidatus Ordinivivax streblomastigis TaxID=2540710 RepID=A0A5M8P0I7_9BACT|nr:MAG: Chaperone SurA [Candidatus Ordinivivax streblomastigis]
MKYFFSFILCLIAFTGGTQAQDNVIDEVIWVIGDDVILRSEVEKMRLEMQSYGERMEGDPYCFIPEQLAIQKLYLHQAKLDSVSIADGNVFSYVESMLKNNINRIGSKEKLEEYTGKTLNVLREEYRQMVREQEMVREVQRKLIGSVKVTPAEVRTFYNRIPQDSLPFIPTTVEVEIITREPKIALEEIDDIKRSLRDYTEQVTSGKREFSTLARMYSEDVVSAKSGGELGFVGRATLMPEFAAVAFELTDPKKVSRIVETEYGFHIIQLIEKRGDRINVRHLLLKPRVSKEELAATSLKMDSLRNDILSPAEAFSFEAAAIFSDDKDTRNNKGLMVNQGTAMGQMTERVGTSRFEMEELPPEVAKVVYEMQVGDISQPFTLINSKQKEVVAIVKLKTRIEGHKASLSEDYQALKSMVEEEKQHQILEKWLAKKQQDTYIRINDSWKNCDFQSKGWVID